MKFYPHRQMSESFITAAFLSVSGGLQDAYTYIFRGKVFANAQTGNIVLLGQNLVDRNWRMCVHYAVPLLFFALGIAAAECIKQKFQNMQQFHWRQIVVLCEIFLLLIVGFLPIKLNLLANAMVSFSCAMQVQAFRKVNGYAFASTMCIGNMRSGMQYLYTGLHTKDRAVLRRAMQYFAVIALFAVGAAAGSLLTIHFGNRVIWFCCASLLVSLSFMFIREDIEENPELQREAAALHQDVKAMEHTIGKTLQEQQEELHPLNHK